MSEKMNVIFFITDQQRADHLGCAGNKILKTPNLDRLASEGVRFSSAYVANPTCMPNRCSIMTGQYPNMCVRTFGKNLDPDIPTYPETLRKEGYTTKAIGKMHLTFWTRKLDKSARSPEYANAWGSEKYHAQMVKNFPKPFYGFEEVDTLIGHGDVCTGHYTDWLEERAPQYLSTIRDLGKKVLDRMYYKSPIPEEFYPTSYCTDRAIDFLEKHAKGEHGDKPFLLKVSYPDPHHPCSPPGKWADMYKPEDMILPENFKDIESVKNHPWLSKNNRLNHPIFKNMIHHITNEEETRNFISHTYGTVSMIDDSVGQILAALEKLGMADNTMIVYTSDHGDMMGDHGMILKGFMPYDGILRVPLIWKVPGVAKKGEVSDSLVSAIDLAPTILNLSNIDKKSIPQDMQGVDVTPVLKDPTEKVRESCLIEVDEADIGMASKMPMAATIGGSLETRVKYLITEKYSLTIYNGLKGHGDIFDRVNDPLQLNNLWYSNPELRHELVEQLLHEVINAQSLYPKKQAMA